MNIRAPVLVARPPQVLHALVFSDSLFSLFVEDDGARGVAGSREGQSHVAKGAPLFVCLPSSLSAGLEVEGGGVVGSGCVLSDSPPNLRGPPNNGCQSAGVTLQGREKVLANLTTWAVRREAAALRVILLTTVPGAVID